MPDSGGFVYRYRDDDWFKHWQMTRFDEFPEGLRAPGEGVENPNLKLRTFFTDGNTGECIPVYEYQGTPTDWERDALMNAKNTVGDPKDGTVIYMHIGRDGEFAQPPVGRWRVTLDQHRHFQISGSLLNAGQQVQILFQLPQWRHEHINVSFARFDA